MAHSTVIDIYVIRRDALRESLQHKTSTCDELVRPERPKMGIVVLVALTSLGCVPRIKGTKSVCEELKLSVQCIRIHNQNRLRGVCMLCCISQIYCGKADFTKPAGIVQHILDQCLCSLLKKSGVHYCTSILFRCFNVISTLLFYFGNITGRAYNSRAC